MPTRYANGYPVAGGTIKGVSFNERVRQGMAGYAPGNDTYGSLPPEATYPSYSPPIQPGDSLYFGGGGPFVDVPTQPNSLTPNPFTGGTDTGGLPGSADLPAASNPFEGAKASGSTSDNPLEGAIASGSTGNGPFEGATAGSYNYYDAGNGVTYVYDENWNYIGTTTVPAVTVQGQPISRPGQGQPGQRAGASSPSQGSYPGGSHINFGTVGLGPSGAIGQGPDAVFGQNYSGNSAAGAFSMQMALEGLGGGGPVINAKYQ